jgi:hypothetical protein
MNIKKQREAKQELVKDCITGLPIYKEDAREIIGGYTMNQKVDKVRVVKFDTRESSYGINEVQHENGKETKKTYYKLVECDEEGVTQTKKELKEMGRMYVEECRESGKLQREVYDVQDKLEGKGVWRVLAVIFFLTTAFAIALGIIF